MWYISSQLLTLSFECQCNTGDRLPKSGHQHHQCSYSWDLNVNNKHYHNFVILESHKMYDLLLTCKRYDLIVIEVWVAAERKQFVATCMYASCGLNLILFLCSVLQIGYNTRSWQFSGLFASGFTINQYITSCSDLVTVQIININYFILCTYMLITCRPRSGTCRRLKSWSPCSANF